MTSGNKDIIFASLVQTRSANIDDINALTEVENACFTSDRLSKRQFRYWVKAEHKVLLVSTLESIVIGYGLVILGKGTSLARLYSLAVLPKHRGEGVANRLLLLLETACIENKRAYLRLEVSENNSAGLSLYHAMGYNKFGYYPHYYEDQSNAVRMQKPILQRQNITRLEAYPYYSQTTEFTCGPAALLMAMARLNDKVQLTQSAELDLWRTATTIFMTAGHGGSHPLGLGIAAVNKGFKAEVFINQHVPLFLAGVRQDHKKAIIEQVEHDFVEKAAQCEIRIHYRDYTVQDISQALESGASVLCLLSSYQFDGYKGPHWVAVTHMDEDFMYIHDPDADVDDSLLISGSVDDNVYRQHVPVSLANFDRYTRFGKAKLRTAIVIRE
jgi:ribosomal protein S18 acetylase RimI-like enzyme